MHVAAAKGLIHRKRLHIRIQERHALLLHAFLACGIARQGYAPHHAAQRSVIAHRIARKQLRQEAYRLRKHVFFSHIVILVERSRLAVDRALVLRIEAHQHVHRPVKVARPTSVCRKCADEIAHVLLGRENGCIGRIEIVDGQIDPHTRIFRAENIVRGTEQRHRIGAVGLAVRDRGGVIVEIIDRHTGNDSRNGRIPLCEEGKQPRDVEISVRRAEVQSIRLCLLERGIAQHRQRTELFGRGGENGAQIDLRAADTKCLDLLVQLLHRLLRQRQRFPSEDIRNAFSAHRGSEQILLDRQIDDRMRGRKCGHVIRGGHCDSLQGIDVRSALRLGKHLGIRNVHALGDHPILLCRLCRSRKQEALAQAVSHAVVIEKAHRKAHRFRAVALRDRLQLARFDIGNRLKRLDRKEAERCILICRSILCGKRCGDRNAIARLIQKDLRDLCFENGIPAIHAGKKPARYR